MQRQPQPPPPRRSTPQADTRQQSDTDFATIDFDDASINLSGRMALLGQAMQFYTRNAEQHRISQNADMHELVQKVSSMENTVSSINDTVNKIKDTDIPRMEAKIDTKLDGTWLRQTWKIIIGFFAILATIGVMTGIAVGLHTLKILP